MEHNESSASQDLYFHTPLLHSTCLSNKFGYNVYLKLENVQPTGSFKIRGIGNRCKKAAENGYSHIVSCSGGNAGLAAAYAGRQLKMLVTVFVPETTPKLMINKIKQEGATVIVKGQAFDEANAYAIKFSKEPGNEYSKRNFLIMVADCSNSNFKLFQGRNFVENAIFIASKN